MPFPFLLPPTDTDCFLETSWGPKVTVLRDRGARTSEHYSPGLHLIWHKSACEVPSSPIPKYKNTAMCQKISFFLTEPCPPGRARQRKLVGTQCKARGAGGGHHCPILACPLGRARQRKLVGTQCKAQGGGTTVKSWLPPPGALLRGLSAGSPTSHVAPTSPLTSWASVLVEMRVVVKDYLEHKCLASPIPWLSECDQVWTPPVLGEEQRVLNPCHKRTWI